MSSSSCPNFQLDQWYPATALTPAPPQLHQWLSDGGSLTARLVAHSQGQFAVQVLSQRWGRCHLSEANALGIAPRARVLVREVILRGKGQPWVYARSILPWQSLTGPLRRLRRFDAQPLGGWLFRQPSLQRHPMQASCFAPGDKRLGRALKEQLSEWPLTKPLWGRRSVFSVYGKPLLVGEVFLPDFVATLAPKDPPPQLELYVPSTSQEEDCHYA
ncbi:chorismate lyase [Pseudomaricurvus alkylphenolicus]|uniref:chorismate--pyruvate lyase family protein n=1 Tax=Pseudomaricurvus alkylphenolicus TaxID=1306991 RepID=UPI001420158C|nr:chorismate lyase [Pseudomaricurvus alkylphenolicus]NIB39449.1 chorismate lyase [Pseudomaricurvus alkylphenolicus]